MKGFSRGQVLCAKKYSDWLGSQMKQSKKELKEIK